MTLSTDAASREWLRAHITSSLCETERANAFKVGLVPSPRQPLHMHVQFAGEQCEEAMCGATVMQGNGLQLPSVGPLHREERGPEKAKTGSNPLLL